MQHFSGSLHSPLKIYFHYYTRSGPPLSLKPITHVLPSNAIHSMDAGGKTALDPRSLPHSKRWSPPLPKRSPSSFPSSLRRTLGIWLANSAPPASKALVLTKSLRPRRVALTPETMELGLDPRGCRSAREPGVERIS